MQLNRLADLEEIVAEQDNKLAVSQENVNKMKKEMEKLKEAKEIELKMQKKKLRLYVFLLISSLLLKIDGFICRN